jgi:hypothetical protein
LVWYFRKYVNGWSTDLDETTLRPFLEKPGARFAIMPTAVAQKVYPSTPPGWKNYSVHGFNTATGKWVDLTLVLKPL